MFVSFGCGDDFFRGRGLAEAVLVGLGLTAAELGCREIELPLLARERPIVRGEEAGRVGGRRGGVLRPRLRR